MPAIPANTGPFLHPKFQFRPNGPDVFHGGRPNPEESYGNKVHAALITVGLTSADEKSEFELDDALAIVRRVREDQVGDPGATFISQRGIYKHSDGRVVTENGVRVIILNLSADEPPKKFHKNMVNLCEALAGELQQERVFLEEQVSGITKGVYGITA